MPEFIEREAKLFEAGSYEDKGLDVTESDLDTIVRSFADNPDVPIKVEHVDTPFDGKLGSIKAVYRRGRELLGRISFPPNAWGLIDAANARKLSVGIKRDLTALKEVSLVRAPRVADAAVFDDRIEFQGTVYGPEIDNRQYQGGDTVPEEKNVTTFSKEEAEAMINRAVEQTKADTVKELSEKFSNQLADKDAQIERLSKRDRERDADATIDALKRTGKLVPAAEEFAKALLLADNGEVVKFGEEDTSISGLFSKLMDAQPAVIEFGEQGATDPEAEVELSATQRELNTKLGIDDETFAKHNKGVK